MEQIGQVIDIKDDKAIVMVRRHDVCGKCGGCGAAISGSGENYIEAVNLANAAVGHTVKVVSDTAHVLKASFVVYIVPILALLIGIYVGQLLDGAFGIFARFDILFGILFLIGSYVLVRGYDRKVADGQTMASVIAIVEDDGPVDEKC